MGKYVFVYYAGSENDGGSSQEWGNWFGKLGDKVIDPGNPFADGGQAVHKGGVMPVKDMPVTGYTIVRADSMEEATALAQGCPVLIADNGTVCVYEALPM